LEEACRQSGLSCLAISHNNLMEVLNSVTGSQIAFRTFLDRAWDAAPAFHPLADWAKTNVPSHINPYPRSQWAIDKATMHLELLGAGLRVPYTHILAPHNQEPNLRLFDLSLLGPSFYVKPAHGGGGIGVVKAATSWEDIHKARVTFPDDKYLIQRKITPASYGGRPAWFRVLHACGAVFPCWWDRETHVYNPVTNQDVAASGLDALVDISRTIAVMTGLRLFSTEMGITDEGHIVVVDAVNDPCDLRRQSRYADGVPDEIWHALTRELVYFVVAARSRV
jgi:hypothetical protein